MGILQPRSDVEAWHGNAIRCPPKPVLLRGSCAPPPVQELRLAMAATAELIPDARTAVGALIPQPMYDIAQTVADGIQYSADDEHAMKRACIAFDAIARLGPWLPT